MLLLTVIVELSGPFIAKNIIDHHILGIEKPWYQVNGKSEKAVEFQGDWYKRSDNIDLNEQKGKEVRILQVSRAYVFVPDELPFDGKRTLSGNKLTIKEDNRQATLRVQRLNAKEVFGFYRPQINGIIFLIVLYLLVMVMASGFEYGRVYFLQLSANRIVQRMRRDVYGQLHRLPMKYFDQTAAGSIVSRVANDTEAVKELFINVLSNFVSGIIYLTSIYIALFILNVKLALICTLIIPILAVWIFLYRKFATTYNRRIRELLSDMSSSINEMIICMPIIRSFRRQKEMADKFESINEEYLASQNKMLSFDALTSYSLANVLKSLVLTVAIWHFGSGSLNANDTISFGVIFAFVDYIGRMFQPVVGIVNQLAQMEQSMVSAERVFEILEMEGTDVIRGGATEVKGHIAFKNVSFAYKKELPILKDISFEAKPGETIAIIGHTGAGKSSIMNTLLRFYEIQKGKITVDGRNIQDIPVQELRQSMAIVLQDTYLIQGTIADNISLNHSGISRNQIEQALLDVGGAAMLSAFPKGLDEPIGEKGQTLSLGQRQLITFARALVSNPKILILDEATSNIDTETEELIQSALNVVKQYRTTLIIAHRLSTIRHADQILLLENGEITERGNHEQLMNLKGKYHQMILLQNGMRENMFAG